MYKYNTLLFFLFFFFFKLLSWIPGVWKMLVPIHFLLSGLVENSDWETVTSFDTLIMINDYMISVLITLIMIILVYNHFSITQWRFSSSLVPIPRVINWSH